MQNRWQTCYNISHQKKISREGLHDNECLLYVMYVLHVYAWHEMNGRVWIVISILFSLSLFFLYVCTSCIMTYTKFSAIKNLNLNLYSAKKLRVTPRSKQCNSIFSKMPGLIPISDYYNNLTDDTLEIKRRRSDPVLWQKPLYQQKCQRDKVTTQTTPQKRSIKQQLRTDLGWSVGVATATQLVWLTGLRAHLPTPRNSRVIKRTRWPVSSKNIFFKNFNIWDLKNSQTFISYG